MQVTEKNVFCPLGLSETIFFASFASFPYRQNAPARRRAGIVRQADGAFIDVSGVPV
jgi:hypothetical protein